MPIIPPPALKVIVDKTAAFVAKNGKSAEKKILARNTTDESKKKFAFLLDTSPFYAYYRQEVDKLALEIYNKDKNVEKIEETKEEIVSEAKLKPYIKKVEENEVIEEEETEMKNLDFILTHPNISEFSTISDMSHKKLEIIKLTAQYVSILGNEFLTSLLQKESNNKDFNFLSLTSPFNPYFLSLVNSYIKLLDTKERKIIISDIVKIYSNREYLLKRCLKRVEEKKEHIQQSMDEQELQENMHIDWNDFVVVQTIEFGRNEEEEKKEKQEEEVEAIEDEDEVEMESDSEEEEIERSDVKVVKHYQPRVVAEEKRRNVVVLPSGEKISANQMNEHVKVDLIDTEQVMRDKAKFEKSQQMDITKQTQISENLKRLAEQRKDIIDDTTRKKQRT